MPEDVVKCGAVVLVTLIDRMTQAATTPLEQRMLHTLEQLRAARQRRAALEREGGSELQLTAADGEIHLWNSLFINLLTTRRWIAASTGYASSLGGGGLDQEIARERDLMLDAEERELRAERTGNHSWARAARERKEYRELRLQRLLDRRKQTSVPPTPFQGEPLGNAVDRLRRAQRRTLGSSDPTTAEYLRILRANVSGLARRAFRNASEHFYATASAAESMIVAWHGIDDWRTEEAQALDASLDQTMANLQADIDEMRAAILQHEGDTSDMEEDLVEAEERLEYLRRVKDDICQLDACTRARDACQERIDAGEDCTFAVPGSGPPRRGGGGPSGLESSRPSVEPQPYGEPEKTPEPDANAGPAGDGDVASEETRRVVEPSGPRRRKEKQEHDDPRTVAEPQEDSVNPPDSPGGEKKPLAQPFRLRAPMFDWIPDAIGTLAERAGETFEHILTRTRSFYGERMRVAQETLEREKQKEHARLEQEAIGLVDTIARHLGELVRRLHTLRRLFRALDVPGYSAEFHNDLGGRLRDLSHMIAEEIPRAVADAVTLTGHDRLARLRTVARTLRIARARYGLATAFLNLLVRSIETGWGDRMEHRELLKLHAGLAHWEHALSSAQDRAGGRVQLEGAIALYLFDPLNQVAWLSPSRSTATARRHRRALSFNRETLEFEFEGSAWVSGPDGLIAIEPYKWSQSLERFVADQAARVFVRVERNRARDAAKWGEFGLLANALMWVTMPASVAHVATKLGSGIAGRTAAQIGKDVGLALAGNPGTVLRGLASVIAGQVGIGEDASGAERVGLAFLDYATGAMSGKATLSIAAQKELRKAVLRGGFARTLIREGLGNIFKGTLETAHQTIAKNLITGRSADAQDVLLASLVSYSLELAATQAMSGDPHLPKGAMQDAIIGAVRVWSVRQAEPWVMELVQPEGSASTSEGPGR